MPVLDRFGLPDAPHGDSAAYPGPYFVGFPFLPTIISGYVIGVTQCAAYVADKIEGKGIYHCR